MTLKQAKAYTAKYAALLKLAHWEIGVQCKAELVGSPGEELHGCIYWNVESRTALMMLNSSYPLQMKATIRHELLHLLLEGHRLKPRNYDAQYEFALNALAELL